ncbi:enoyl-CoA hydratase/isomerase family protein [Peribacillus asahii]|uniref:Ethylmalonyl-CoA decarboxylase n=1 Tax=Peribacillus asahii TaxID=228899 RepID=A0A398BDK7_9BACI|nr:enoyl-CoA hydratase/isomerase family protein [Peribacillus asahii]RID87684.1 enoyl-CoA hydratase/isomerase family protein [Peribacillus asahii]
MSQTVLVEKNERGYMKFILHRPEKRNAVSYQLMEEFEAALDQAAQDNDVKVVVITGYGDRAFCSGGDLAEFHSLYTEEESYGMLSKMGAILYKLAVFKKPTIALLNGSAVGGGCEIASACDFRLAKSGVKLGFVQASLGITTGWGGASILLEKIPYQSAMKLLLNGTIYTAEAAKELGFIDEVIQGDLEEWERFVDTILNREVGVLMAYKNLLINKWEETDLKGRMEMESRQCAKLWETDAHHQAVDSFLNKTK